MADSDTIDLKAVLDRFNSSQSTLVELGEKLRSLTLAEESVTDASTSVASAAAATTRAAEALAELVAASTAAQEALREAVQAAADFVGATDLAGLTTSIRTLEEELGARIEGAEKAVAKQQDLHQKETTERIHGLQEEVIGSIVYVQKRLADNEQQMTTLVASVSELKVGLAEKLSSKDAEIAELRDTLERVRSVVPDRHLAKAGLVGG